MKVANRWGSHARSRLLLSVFIVVLMTGGLLPAASGLPVDTETAMARPQSSADLRAFQGTAVDGGGLAYELTVTNLGPDVAPNVTVTLPLPQGVTFDRVYVSITPERPVRCTTPPSNRTGDVVCSLGDFRPNELGFIAIIINVVGAPGTKLATEARVTSDAPDPNPNNNTMKYEATIPPLPRIISVRALANPFRLEIVGETPFSIHFSGRIFGIGCDCLDWPLFSAMGNTVILEGGRELKRQFPKGVPVQICYLDEFRGIVFRVNFTR